MTRGFACDVRDPLGGVPARAVIRKTGLTHWEHVHFPESFVPVGLAVQEGRYAVTWYEADEEWELHAIAQAAFNITFEGAEDVVAERL